MAILVSFQMRGYKVRLAGSMGISDEEAGEEDEESGWRTQNMIKGCGVLRKLEMYVKR